MPKAAAILTFPTIEVRGDTRTLAERVADVLSESHREDTPPEFRLGLLQGALAVAMPQFTALEGKAAPKAKAKPRARRRSRSHA